MLLYAVVTITLALVFYTIGVWGEKLQGHLKAWHMILFWIGLAFDTTGTTLMGKIANDAFKFNFHAITGLIAILLMLFHAVWATIVLAKKDSVQISKFHRFSINVWIIWLVPFISGMIYGMMQ